MAKGPARMVAKEFRAYFEMRELSDKKATKEIPITSGCFMLCRSNVIKEISGFDRNYFLYFEDFDLSLRVGSVSSLAYLPTMRIVHNGGDAAKKGIRHIFLFICSGFRFFSKHGWRWF